VAQNLKSLENSPSITTHTSRSNQAFLDMKPQQNFRNYNDKDGENDVLETMVFGTKVMKVVVMKMMFLKQ
jgi:hypothetical protein